jgi:hypothetical protein
MSMKIALPLTLAIGGISLLLALLATFMFYLDWASQSKLQVILPPPHFAESVASAQDLSHLKLGCLSMAQSLDSNICVVRDQSIFIERLISGIAWFALAWGLVSGLVFLYVHLLLRRVAKIQE